MTATAAFMTQLEELQRAARDVADFRDGYDAARERRDQLIVDASDLNVPQRAIAKATGLSQPRIIAIILSRTGQAAEAPASPR